MDVERNVSRILRLGVIAFFVAVNFACAGQVESPKHVSFIHPDVNVSAYLTVAKELSRKDQLVAPWEMSVPMAGKNSDKKHYVNSCEKALVAYEENAEILQPFMARPFRYAIVQCAALKLATQLQNSQELGFSGFSLNEKTIGEFPIDLAFYTSTKEKQSAVESYRYLREGPPLINCELIDENETRCNVEGGTQTFKQLIRGDVNRDGAEDLVLQVTNAVEGGSYSVTKLYVLSRDQGEESLRILEKW